MGKYIPPDKETIVSAIQPWLRGFIQKEYGSHTNPDDRLDLEQEGLVSLLHLLARMEGNPPRFNSEDEFQYYIKAVIRNAIRDYILKFRSRFGISLFKLRRELKGKAPLEDDDSSDRRLGEFMNTVGEQYTYLCGGEEAEDPAEQETTQRRLSLLARATKNCRELDIDESKKLLFDVIEEYKRTESVAAPFEAPRPTAAPTGIPTQTPGVTRAPVSAGRRGPKKCASRFCNTDLTSIKTVIIDRGFGYCTKRCKKEWPPTINRIQSAYGNTPIELILSVSLKLFRSKKRAAEVLDISATTFEKLAVKFEIGE